MLLLRLLKLIQKYLMPYKIVHNFLKYLKLSQEISFLRQFFVCHLIVKLLAIKPNVNAVFSFKIK